MATELDVTQKFAASPATCFAMLMNEQYVTRKSEATGSERTTVTIDGTPDGPVTITSVRVLPADVPDMAKSFVGDTIEVTEVQTWSAPNGEGERSGTIAVTFSAPLNFSGTLALTADADGSVVHTKGEMKSKVPFIGGQVESMAVAQTERYLRKEEKVGAEWLTQGE